MHISAVTSWQLNLKDFPESADNRDKIIFLLRYAILSPSTHNIQPWKFKIAGDSASIFLDETKKLPANDPLDRDLYISLGYCVETLAQAADSFGVLKTTQVFTGRSDNMVATISFDFSKYKLRSTKSLEGIINRINARGKFSDKALPADLMQILANISKSNSVQAHFVTDKAGIKRLAELTAEGLRMAYHDPVFRREISSWIRNNWSKRRDGIPGYSLRMPAPMSLVIARMMRHFDIGDKLGKLNQMSLQSAQMICVITAKNSSPNEWLEVGRVAMRIMIELNARGIRSSVFVASVEMGELYKEVQKVINSSETPQFLFSAGYMDDELQHTPRHDVESFLL